jgi:hypothetical protein
VAGNTGGMNTAEAAGELRKDDLCPRGSGIRDGEDADLLIAPVEVGVLVGEGLSRANDAGNCCVLTPAPMLPSC